MAKLLLTISERHRLLTILNDFKGNLDTLAVILEDVKKIRIEDDEWTKAERVITKVKDETGKEVEQWNWQDEKAGEKEVELEKDTTKFLKDSIAAKDKAGEITVADVILISINKKLNS